MQQASVVEKMVAQSRQKRCSECNKTPIRWTTKGYDHLLTEYVSRDACYKRRIRKRSPDEEDIPGFSYAELVQENGPSLIVTAFKDEFVQWRRQR